MKIRLAWTCIALVFISACDRSATKSEVVELAAVSASSVVPNMSPVPSVVIDKPDAAPDAELDASSSNEFEDAGTNEPCPSGMAYLPEGKFKLGETGRRVNVTAFCLDKQEVTVAAYTQCVKAKACSPRCIEENRCSAVPVDTEWGNAEEDTKASRRCNGGIPGHDEHPVNCVSFEEATAYCVAQGKRLPREEEWEWAIRGGPAAMRYPWGKFDAHAEELCWGKPHKDRQFKRAGTCVVGSHPLDTTPEGIQDMAGNVSEWVIGTTGGRTYPSLRGASFWAVDDGYVKAAMWGFDSPAKRSEIFGIRCARDARSSEKMHSSDVAR